jgi:pimeloyl-ACP methyl ester carboxylesterase
LPDLRIGVEGATLVASYSPAGDTVLVALHGASAGTRDHPLYRHLHAVLPPAGIGVVTFDRRGEGASSGDPSVGQFEQQARDALAIAGAVGARRIGLWGFSQGGWVAPIAATMSDNIDFLVLIASTGVSPHEQMLYANAEQLRRAGHGPHAIGRAQELRRALQAWVLDPDPFVGESLGRALADARSEPWWELTYLPSRLPDEVGRAQWASEMAFDPRPVFEQVKVPVLLFYGADDGWTPVDVSVGAWRAAAGDRAQVHVLPGAGHDLTLPDGSLAPGYEERLVDWCRRMADA